MDSLVSKDPLQSATRILIVEDETQIAELYMHVLNKAGMMVKIAKDGMSALEILEVEKFDVTFIDIMMPKMNGIDLLRNMRLRKINPQMAVVFLTNMDQEAVIQQGFSLGIQGYLIKSQLAPQQLVDVVKNNIKAGGENAALKITPQNQPKSTGLFDKILSKLTNT